MKTSEPLRALRRELASLSEEKYRAFSQKITPTAYLILGVRVPALRQIARRLIRSEPFDFSETPESFEEIMIEALLVAERKRTPQEKWRDIRRFLPRVDNWAVCDLFGGALKTVRETPGFWRPLFLPLFSDRREFYVRFAAVISLSHFLTDRLIDEELSRLALVRHEGYYAKMGVAWALSVAYVKFPNSTEPLLQSADLDPEIRRKAIQKILESNRVSPEIKAELRAQRMEN